MLMFNALLAASEIDPSTVRLVRHRHRGGNHRAMVDDAIRRHSRFDEFQRGQAEPGVVQRLSSSNFWASFVALPGAETLFVGVWSVVGVKRGHLPDPYRPDHGKRAPTSVVFDLERSEALHDYAGRILVDWGGGERAWVQYAERRNKPIVELRRRVQEPQFPGFLRFSCSLDAIDVLPVTWVVALRATRGVYLIVHRATGVQYVGVASGEDGFIGRWRQYADGHGGNVAMRELSHHAGDYDVSVLETFGSNVSFEEACDLETVWKGKLGSRVVGLNRN